MPITAVPQGLWLPPRTATLFVAANDASDRSRAQTDVPLNDIAVALAALPAGVQGEIVLSEGNFDMTARTTIPAGNITIRGQGDATILRLANGVDDNMFYATGRTGLVIKDMQIDGNRANNAGADPIYFNDCDNFKLLNLYIHDCDDHGIRIDGTSYEGWILDCHIKDCDESGIYLLGDTGYDILIKGNLIESTGYGILSGWWERLKIIKNTFKTVADSGYLGYCVDSLCANNIFYDINIGLKLYGPDNCVTSNIFKDLVTGIWAEPDSDNCMFTNNLFRTCTTPINIVANSDLHQVMGNNWQGCTNDMADAGTNTRITSNIDKAGAWFAGDDPG